MLTSIHFILTYRCTSECEHCFVYGSPNAIETFTVEQLRTVFREIDKIPTIESIYFEGGEPFLYYPLLLEGTRLAQERHLNIGIISNVYWATDEVSAELWLQPLVKKGLSELGISDDAFHNSKDAESLSQFALKAAGKMGISAYTMCIEEPSIVHEEKGRKKGEPIVGGDVRFRGRAADCLVQGLPRRGAEAFIECPEEDLGNPSRVHVDPLGNIHLCQGLLMGNMWQTPLSTLVNDYNGLSHSIVKTMIIGGPKELARQYGIHTEAGYVDACHMCFEVRKQLMDQFPEYLGPQRVYGEGK